MDVDFEGKGDLDAASEMEIGFELEDVLNDVGSAPRASRGSAEGMADDVDVGC